MTPEIDIQLQKDYERFLEAYKAAEEGNSSFFVAGSVPPGGSNPSSCPCDALPIIIGCDTGTPYDITPTSFYIEYCDGKYINCSDPCNPQDAYTSGTLQYSLDNSTWFDATYTTSPGGIEHHYIAHVTNLTPNTTYYIRIHYTIGACVGCTVNSTVVTVTTPDSLFETSNPGLTLFVEGAGFSDDSLTLYIENNDIPTGVNDNIDLFVWGYDSTPEEFWFTYRLGSPQSELGNIVFAEGGIQTSKSRSATLYISGIESSGNFSAGFDPVYPLFIKGLESFDSSLTLFIGDKPFWAIPLFIKADDVPTVNDSLELSMFASTNYGQFSGIDLHTFSDDDLARDASIPLSIIGPDSITSVKNMNLFVYGGMFDANGSIELYLENTQLIETFSLELFIAGDGGTDGATPFSSDMSLYLERNTANAIPLHINGPGDEGSSTLTLYVSSAYFSDDNMELSIPEIVGYNTASKKLYIHGW